MSNAYKLYKDGEFVNIIAADEAFVTEYAAQNGYTFEEIIYPAPDPEPEPTPAGADAVWDELAAALQEGVTSLDQ